MVWPCFAQLLHLLHVSQVCNGYYPIAVCVLPGSALHPSVFTEPTLNLPAVLDLGRRKSNGVKVPAWPTTATPVLESVAAWISNRDLQPELRLLADGAMHAFRSANGIAGECKLQTCCGLSPHLMCVQIPSIPALRCGNNCNWSKVNCSSSSSSCSRCYNQS